MDCESHSLTVYNTNHNVVVEGGRKRSFEILMEAEYAKYGVTDGVMLTKGERLNCGVLCKGWPGWCMTAQARGWNIIVIVLKDCLWEQEIRRWFPSANVVKYEACEPWHVTSSPIDVWYSDVDPPRKLNIWVSRADYIVTFRRARLAPTGWSKRRLTLNHEACGGVTTGEWSFFLYHRCKARPFDNPISVAGRDLSSVLNTKLQGLPCPPPVSVPGLCRKAIEVRPNTYHGGGLLPW